ncbi:hypothetical protein OG258_19835 [Streptomyces mirabilis]|uniref:hypothetical protein n=1 Tax=Streptomyces mirabilis TaxID=68239 RepID=UPI002E2CDF46|nr:hypothetical protein [Streptomyces mirabilis]
MSALDQFIVGYGPEMVQDLVVLEDGCIEAVTTREVRVYERQPDSSLVELHGEAKDKALTAFWEGVEDFNTNGDNA